MCNTNPELTSICIRKKQYAKRYMIEKKINENFKTSSLAIKLWVSSLYWLQVVL